MALVIGGWDIIKMVLCMWWVRKMALHCQERLSFVEILILLHMELLVQLLLALEPLRLKWVLATQCIMQPKPKKMRINVNGKLGLGVTPKDIALYIISKLTTSGATGYFVEYAGEVFEKMTMEGRMTVCNLSIEMGARGGMIAPDEKTFAYIKGRDKTPKGGRLGKGNVLLEKFVHRSQCYF